MINCAANKPSRTVGIFIYWNSLDDVCLALISLLLRLDDYFTRLLALHLIQRFLIVLNRKSIGNLIKLFYSLDVTRAITRTMPSTRIVAVSRYATARGKQ